MSGDERVRGLVIAWLVIVGGSALGGLLTRATLGAIRAWTNGSFEETLVRMAAGTLVLVTGFGIYVSLEGVTRRLRSGQSLWTWLLILHGGRVS